jgi:hypothetical protein
VAHIAACLELHQVGLVVLGEAELGVQVQVQVGYLQVMEGA